MVVNIAAMNAYSYCKNADYCSRKSRRNSIRKPDTMGQGRRLKLNAAELELHLPRGLSQAHGTDLAGCQFSTRLDLRGAMMALKLI